MSRARPGQMVSPLNRVTVARDSNSHLLGVRYAKGRGKAFGTQPGSANTSIVAECFVPSLRGRTSCLRACRGRSLPQHLEYYLPGPGPNVEVDEDHLLPGAQDGPPGREGDG